MRGSQKEKLELLDDHIKFQLPERLTNDFEYLSVLQNAISAKHILEIDYGNKLSEISRREVEPIGLIFYAFGWHLIAFCHMRNEYRDFKVVRILKIRNTEKTFRKFDHISLNDYMKELPVNY